jgi:hypothetical protein
MTPGQAAFAVTCSSSDEGSGGMSLARPAAPKARSESPGHVGRPQARPDFAPKVAGIAYALVSKSF